MRFTCAYTCVKFILKYFLIGLDVVRSAGNMSSNNNNLVHLNRA